MQHRCHCAHKEIKCTRVWRLEGNRLPEKNLTDILCYEAVCYHEVVHRIGNNKCQQHMKVSNNENKITTTIIATAVERTTKHCAAVSSNQCNNKQKQQQLSVKCNSTLWLCWR